MVVGTFLGTSRVWSGGTELDRARGITFLVAMLTIGWYSNCSPKDMGLKQERAWAQNINGGSRSEKLQSF